MTNEQYEEMRKDVLFSAVGKSDARAIVIVLTLIAEELRRWRLGIVTNDERAAQLGVGKWPD